MRQRQWIGMSRHKSTEECMNNAIRVGFVATVLTFSACVPQGKYDAAAKDLQNARAAAQREHDDNLRSAADIAKARAQIDQSAPLPRSATIHWPARKQIHATCG